MNRFLIAFISIVLILGAVLMVAPGFFNWNNYKGQATDLIKEQTGLDVVLNGDIKIAILPSPHAYIRDVEVRSAREGHYPNLATLERLDLNLAFAPLLSGKVELTSVELVKPTIHLETYADGRQNWETDEIVALKEGSKEENAAQTEQAVTETNMMDSISLDSVTITDGVVGFYNSETKAEQIIQNIDLTLKADTLSGPFYAEGNIEHQERSITFDAQTGRINENKSAVPLSANVAVTPNNVKLVYNGIMDMGDAFAVQGETRLTIENLASFLENLGVKDSPVKAANLDITGVLTANAETFSLKEAVIDLGNSRLAGTLDGTVSPLSLDLDMRSEKLDMATLADLPALANVKAAAISGRFSSTDKGFAANNLSLKLDDTDVTGDVLMHTVPAGSKPQLTVKLASKNLDMNKFMKVEAPQKTSDKSSASNAGAAPSDLKSTLQSIEIPVNADFDIALDKGRYGTYSFSGLVAKGSVNGSALRANQISVRNFADSAVSLKGNIANIKSLEGVDMVATLNSSNIRALADVLKVDISALPEGMNTADASLQAKGSASSMDVTANVKAMNGEVIVAGIVQDVLGSFKTGGLDLQVKHRNFNEAMNILSPGSSSFEDMNKPLDFYAMVVKKGNEYDLNNIKANIGGIDAEGFAGLDTSGAKPYFKGDIRLGKVNIGNKTAGGKAAPANGGGNAPAAAQGWSGEAMSSAWMNAMNFDVSLVAQSINYQGWDMASPSLKASMNNGVLTLQQLQSGLYQGQVFLTGKMQPASKDSGYAIDGSINLRDVSLEPLVGSLTGNRILTGKGLISSDTTIKTAGVSPAALVSGLNGNGVVTGKDITLTGFDLTRFARALSSETKPGDTALGIWKGTIKGGSTEFDTLSGEFNIAQGIVNIAKMDLDGPRAAVTTRGKVDLPQFTIATTHNISLKEEGEVPPFEIKINGPLNNPGQTFGQGLLNDYISRKVNRKIESFITDKLGDKLGLPKAQTQEAAPVVQNPAADQPAAANDNANGSAAEPSPTGMPEQQAPDAQDGQTSQPQHKEITPEEAIQGLLKGLIR